MYCCSSEVVLTYIYSHIYIYTYQFTVLKDEQERNGLHTLTKTLQYVGMLKNPVIKKKNIKSSHI